MKDSKVFIEERFGKIINVVAERKRVTVNELCEYFNVSVVTIRNDLNELSRKGKIHRTHGGAIAIDDTHSDLPFDKRRKANYEIKKAIANEAAGLVNDGEVIFIDGGTTCVEVPTFLKKKIDITVITPSIEVAHWLLSCTPFNVYMLNGFLNRKSYSALGAPHEGFMAGWNIAKAFFGAAGFTIRDGLTDRHMGFVEQKSVIAKKAQSIIALIDSTKLGIVSLGSICGAKDIDMIITDNGISREVKDTLKINKVKTIIV